IDARENAGNADSSAKLLTTLPCNVRHAHFTRQPAMSITILRNRYKEVSAFRCGFNSNNSRASRPVITRPHVAQSPLHRTELSKLLYCFITSL
ncbi:MAG TPA: hypothetical protein VJU59_10015, partial [Paraburkholderia sp.]|uniref:hypothetical protein n=1 Tax=Paraburkholderia sp. TaxID=1926495 RepID=UPI002B48A2AE